MLTKDQGFALPVLLLIFVVVVVGVIFVYTKVTGTGSVTEVAKKATNIISGGGGFSIDKDTPGYENYKTLMQGCPFKDCIPSIDSPVFESISDADEWLDDDDVVFVLESGSQAKAYSQKILNWHEIVNDDGFTVTFCPLCGSALAFDRDVNGQTLEFGVSGKLHNNDLVMYDRQTESLWQQITGEAIVGELFGERLTQIPLSGMRWSQFKEDFPQGLSLSRDTGTSRNYDRYPYGSYEQDPNPLFPVEGGVDNTIHPKTVVYGVEVNDSYKAYPVEKLEAEGVIDDSIDGVSLRISYNNGDVTVENLTAGIEIPATRLFWFAWKAFRPNTQLY